MNDEDTPTGEHFKLKLSGNGLAIDRDVDADTAMQIVSLVMGSGAGTTRSARSRRATKRRSTTTSTPKPRAKRGRRAESPSVVKDLSLRPSGKQSFQDFANEKKPRSHQEKQAVAVYWLTHEAGLTEGITTNHVNTCYTGANWTRPSDLRNAMQVTSTVKGWLDTSDMDNIRITVPGEDLVRHELPRDKD